MGEYTKPLDTVQMTPYVEAGKIRFVLSWPHGPKDLDIHTMYRISRFSKCEVFFGKRNCLGTSLDTDNFNGGHNGVETVTISTLGKYVYTFAVHKYVDISGGVAKGDDPVPGVQDQEKESKSIKKTVPDTPLPNSNARISVYVNGFKGAIYKIEAPSPTSQSGVEKDSKSEDIRWWLGFCLNGKEGVESLAVINKYSVDKPHFSLCEKYYRKNSFLQISSNKIRNIR